MSRSKFLADECTFLQTVRFMRALGFHVERTQDIGLQGAEDSAVLARAQETGAILVTNDKSFGNTSAYPPSSHQGVIVLKMRADPHAVRRVHEVLRSLLESETRFEGLLFVVDVNKYRRRRTP
jgi:predicted nuclease of predicted toxin-antitoxin system